MIAVIREIYRDSQEEFTIKVEASRISSFRKKKVTRKAVRVYENGKIGIAGAIGEASEEELLEKAKEKMAFSVEYKPQPSKGIKKSVENGCYFKSEEKMKEEFEALLGELREKHPEFLYNGWGAMKRFDTSLENDLSLSLHHKITIYEFLFLLKRIDTANMLDGYLWVGGTDYDPKKVREVFDEVLTALKKDLEWKEERVKMPVIFVAAEAYPVMIFQRDLHPLKFASNGSLFSGKLGQKIFSDSFTLYASRSFEDGNYVPFFDMEGTTLEGDRKALVEDGVLMTPYTSKKYAMEFGYELTASASGDFDAVPDVGYSPMAFKPTHQKVKDIVNGRAIFALVSSGGDYTPEGSFSLPVQVPLLYEDGKFVGKLPPLRVSSDVWKMFGKDFLGVSREGILMGPETRAVVFEMEVTKEI